MTTPQRHVISQVNAALAGMHHDYANEDDVLAGYYVAGLLAECLKVMIYHHGDEDAIKLLSEMINGYMRGWAGIQDD